MVIWGTSGTRFGNEHLPLSTRCSSSRSSVRAACERRTATAIASTRRICALSASPRAHLALARKWVRTEFPQRPNHGRRQASAPQSIKPLTEGHDHAEDQAGVTVSRDSHPAAAFFAWRTEARSRQARAAGRRSADTIARGRARRVLFSCSGAYRLWHAARGAAASAGTAELEGIRRRAPAILGLYDCRPVSGASHRHPDPEMAAVEHDRNPRRE